MCPFVPSNFVETDAMFCERLVFLDYLFVGL